MKTLFVVLATVVTANVAFGSETCFQQTRSDKLPRQICFTMVNARWIGDFKYELDLAGTADGIPFQTTTPAANYGEAHNSIMTQFETTIFSKDIPSYCGEGYKTGIKVTAHVDTIGSKLPNFIADLIGYVTTIPDWCHSRHDNIEPDWVPFSR